MLAAGNRLGGSDRQGLPTVQHTFKTSGGAGLVVPELRLSTVRRLPPCAGCQKVKRPTGGAYHAKNRPVWLCPACKVCPQCGQPMQGMSKLGTWCQSCAYPPCAGCQQVARPGGDHAYHAKHRPFWRCAQCALESCPRCQANPLGQDAGGGPDAACP